MVFWGKKCGSVWRQGGALRFSGGGWFVRGFRRKRRVRRGYFGRLKQGRGFQIWAKGAAAKPGGGGIGKGWPGGSTGLFFPKKRKLSFNG
ncbi:MAG: hypothetical protein D6714_07595 [Bacteroidetes bacterium]|nr:MAG: hypothetical protein D6714_07595 [Bacteroidota bacterium]